MILFLSSIISEFMFLFFLTWVAAGERELTYLSVTPQIPARAGELHPGLPHGWQKLESLPVALQGACWEEAGVGSTRGTWGVGVQNSILTPAPSVCNSSLGMNKLKLTLRRSKISL